jgi:hypothetical protein
VAASRSAHISCNDFGSALHTDAHGKNEPCRAVKPKAKRDVEQWRSMRGAREGQAVAGWRATALRREQMMDARVCAAGQFTRVVDGGKLSRRTGAADRESRQPNGGAQPAARRVVRWRARRQSAHDVVENRSDRAVGCSRCWAGRPGWQLLSRHTLAAMPLAVPSTRPSTARMSRAEPCKQRRSAKTSEGEAYAACVRCIRWLAGVRRRADERR